MEMSPIPYNTTKNALYETLKRMKDEGSIVLVRPDDDDGWTIVAHHSVSRIGMDDETQELFDSLVDGE